VSLVKGGRGQFRGNYLLEPRKREKKISEERISTSSGRSAKKSKYTVVTGRMKYEQSEGKGRGSENLILR